MEHMLYGHLLYDSTHMALTFREISIYFLLENLDSNFSFKNEIHVAQICFLVKFFLVIFGDT